MREWWRFRVPGYGSVDWRGFFSVLADAGYTGAMNIENEDEFYYPAYDQGNFTEQFKRGFRVGHEFLKTLVPPVALARRNRLHAIRLPDAAAAVRAVVIWLVFVIVAEHGGDG